MVHTNQPGEEKVIRTMDRNTTPKEACSKLKLSLLNLQITYRNVKYASGMINIKDSPVEIFNLSISTIWGLLRIINNPSLENKKGTIKIKTPIEKPNKNLEKQYFRGLLL